MKRIYDTAPSQIHDMKKRFAKEFAEGIITREQFNDIDKSLSYILTMSQDIEGKHVCTEKRR